MNAEIEADFFAAAARRPAVYRGNPFLVEVGLAHQRGACAITRAVADSRRGCA